MTEEISKRQAAVKDILTRYSPALDAADEETRETTQEFLEEYKELLEEVGVTLYAEEALATIVLLEALIDPTGKATKETMQAGAVSLIMAMASELRAKWLSKDKEWFLE